jgi:hypothetical protein
MKPPFSAILSILFIGFFAMNGRALPKYGVSSLTSPTKEYTLKLVDTSTPYEYQLRILRHGNELAHYPFEGELISAYWSPNLKFVAIDNHWGMGGFHVWIVSLADGSVITSHGVVKGSNYDRYIDDGYFSNLLDEAHEKLKKINPGIDNDQLRDGYKSVAYGWTTEGNLLMFHQFPFDDFGTKYGLIIQGYSIWKVTDHNVSLKSISFKTARDDRDELMPSEVKKTLNFIP